MVLRVPTIILLSAITMFGCLSRAEGGPQPRESLIGTYGKYFDIGTAVPPGLSDAEQQLLIANFSTVTPENCMKPRETEPEEGQFTFDDADHLVEFAQAHHLKVNGHTLVWHSQTPNWFFTDGANPAAADLVRRRLDNHVRTEVERYRGKIASWDVVNEVVSDNPNDYLRQSKWFKALGEGFIADAFRVAHAADPSAGLYLNDYSIEQPAKREKVLKLIRSLKEQNVPIDGVGIQGHWLLNQVPYRAIEDSIIAFNQAGVKVAFSEVDLDVVPRKNQSADVNQRENGTEDPYAAACPPEVLQREAEQYAKLFALFRKHADKISRVTLWGLHDGRSWLNEWPRRRTDYALLFSRDLQPKPAFYSVVRMGAP